MAHPPHAVPPGSGSKILVIALQGIGNSLFLVPMLEEIRRSAPGAEIHLLLKDKSVRAVLDNDRIVTRYHYTPRLNLAGVPGLLRTIGSLRRLKFDYSLIAFPGNHFFFNIVSFLSGARRRISHKYPDSGLASCAFLNTLAVPLRQCHDYEQNLGLLAGLGMKTDVPWTPHLWGWPVRRITRVKTVGFHPGSSSEHDMIQKRWHWSNFMDLVRRLNSDRPGLAIRLFFGPDEADLMERFRELESGEVRLVAGYSLDETIRRIAAMDLFVSNDSGLMNIAAGLGCRVMDIAGGPTDPVRSRPAGAGGVILFSDIHCYPCRGLANIGKKFRCIYPTRRCLEALKAESVYKALEAMLIP